MPAFTVVNVRSQGDARRHKRSKISFSELYPKFRIERDYFSELALRTHPGAQMKIIDLQEARKTQRRPALDMGLIRFGDISMSCVLRNVSEGGAALDIGSQVGIPDQFTLIVLPQRKIYSCNVIWRKERRMGVQFTGPNENPPA